MSLRRFSRLLPIRNPCELRGLYRRSCVFITAGPITKLFAGGGGGEWRTCAMIDDEPRPVWKRDARGLAKSSYFGPRTCGRSKHHFHRLGSVRDSQSGFPHLIPTPFPCHHSHKSQVTNPYWGRCNAIVPLHLPDALEYVFCNTSFEVVW